jgi:crotonobetainyl-CoA:carnitine CoA-transferase CaiB-like acyl-CoA transferase
VAGPLEGFRVLDLSAVVAGPIVARNLGDLGAEVIKVEHPRQGDAAREMGWQVDGESLWWKVLGRNKLPITLDLSTPRGAALCLRLAEVSDVLVESFRPGTLERWGLGPDALLAVNPGLVVVRVSGFGQNGPYAARPGFGTLAEAMSGWAGTQGEEGGPPQLPATALADEAAGIHGTAAALAALLHRERGWRSERRVGGGQVVPPVSERSERRVGGGQVVPPVSERSERRVGGGQVVPPVSERSERRVGGGQVIDVSLYEPLLGMLGPLPAVYAATGEEAPRVGNRLPFAAPRGAYRCADDRWIALSGTSPASAHRILRAIGRADLVEDPRFATNAARLEHAEELDALLAAWAAGRSRDEALAVLEAHDAAAGPVYRMGDLLADAHVRERGSVVEVPDDDLGTVAMADVAPRLEGTPGAIRWAGRAKGSANAEVYGGLLGLGDDELHQLATDGVI